MAIVVADLQTALANRCGGMFTAAGLDGSATSTLWLEPIASSARELNITLASPLTVVDADLAGVTQPQVSQLIDVAEFRALESALENFQKVSQKISLGEQAKGEIRDGLENAIERKARYVRDKYGVGRGTLTGGEVCVPFQEPFWPFGWEGWGY